MKTDHQVNEKKQRATKLNERGYAMVGLMGVMMFALILTTVAAPALRLEAQREKEEEMLWRGQQIATALSRYRRMRGTYPNDLDELVKGVEIGVKKLRFLRPSALCDPMTPCDGMNWRLVHPGDPLPKELMDAIVATQEKRQMPLNPQSLGELARFAQMGATRLPGQPADTQLDGQIGPVNDQPNNSGSDGNFKKGPVIGVVSKKSDRMFRSYYGIEQYDHVLFFPDVPVIAGGFINPLVMGFVGGGNAGGKDPNCPAGGVFIDGKCWGGLIPGPQKRDPNAPPTTQP
jgi:type II secretory pathway pseudopilin PulG